ncbi:unnamed protein product [Somion occarium]|uniref:Uncharacterized protein n=1 Tax=Somion occarium TaxID=3059160 RepID=A0ABP1CGA3_9APHY
MSPQPRPILKRDSSFYKQISIPLPFAACGSIFSPHVHFPPTPGLSETHPAHSPQTYDRAPIVVSPNACLLPERHDRRVYSPTIEVEIERPQRGRPRSRTSKHASVKGSYFHPRAYEACEPEPPSDSVPVCPPPLVHDSSSPSDEDMVSTPPDHRISWFESDGRLPLLTDVYASPVSPQGSDHGPDLYTVAYGVEKRQRPNLGRMGNSLSAKAAKGFCAQLDEGCLGGF